MDMIWKLSAERVAASQSRLTVLLCERRGFQFTRGACESSKARGGASGELQQHADHPPETDPDIPNDGRSLVKHDHTYRHERCKGGEECAGAARQRNRKRLRTRTAV